MPQNVEIIKADTQLQEKAGTGPLDEETIARCEKAMEENTVDFAIMAKKLLSDLDDTIKKLASKEIDKKEGTQAMRITVMELKANAGTFQYDLISKLAKIMLNFLEKIEIIDGNVLEIVGAHQKTLSLIIAKRMKGNGGEHGVMFEKELTSACKRYFESQK